MQLNKLSTNYPRPPAHELPHSHGCSHETKIISDILNKTMRWCSTATGGQGGDDWLTDSPGAAPSLPSVLSFAPMEL
jgi:hypothetical protein